MPHGGQNIVDRVGHRYGKLTVVERAGRKGTAAAWLCQCDCGKTKVIASNALRATAQGLRSGTRSCGCSRATGKGSRAHYKCRLPPGTAARAKTKRVYEKSAEYRGLEWGLSDEDFDELTRGDCAYCGVPPSNEAQTSRNGAFVYNGIDRLDNAVGYMPGNVASCCATCNHAKRDMSESDFRAWIVRLVAHARTQSA